MANEDWLKKILAHTINHAKDLDALLEWKAGAHYNPADPPDMNPANIPQQTPTQSLARLKATVDEISDNVFTHLAWILRQNGGGTVQPMPLPTDTPIDIYYQDLLSWHRMMYLSLESIAQHFVTPTPKPNPQPKPDGNWNYTEQQYLTLISKYHLKISDDLKSLWTIMRIPLATGPYPLPAGDYGPLLASLRQTTATLSGYLNYIQGNEPNHTMLIQLRMFKPGYLRTISKRNTPVKQTRPKK